MTIQLDNKPGTSATDRKATLDVMELESRNLMATGLTFPPLDGTVVDPNITCGSLSSTEIDVLGSQGNDRAWLREDTIQDIVDATGDPVIGVQLLAGNDRFAVESTPPGVSFIVCLDTGNDNAKGPKDAPAEINLGPGKDRGVLRAPGVLSGDSGDDTLSYRGPQTDSIDDVFIDGGHGRDKLSSRAIGTYDGGPGPDKVKGRGMLIGGGDADRITALFNRRHLPHFANTVIGGADPDGVGDGGDRITARAGDVVFGGDGPDDIRIYQGRSTRDSVISGGGGVDTFQRRFSDDDVLDHTFVAVDPSVGTLLQIRSHVHVLDFGRKV